MPKDRGAYVSVYTVLLDSPEYDALSLNAASVWWALKLAPEAGILGVFRVFEDQLSHRSKIPVEWIAGALQELEEAGWIKTEGRWVWIRNHLRFNPGFMPGNPKHISGLIDRISGLPKIDLVAECIAYYKALNYLPGDLESSAVKSIQTVPITITEAVTVTEAVSKTKTIAATAPTNDSSDTRALVDSYNAVFNASIGYTPGNLKAAARYFAEGYNIEQAMTLFAAVLQCSGPTATWAHAHNCEFEYLVRPTYQRGGQTIQAMTDRVLNELVTGRPQNERPQ